MTPFFFSTNSAYFCKYREPSISVVLLFFLYLLAAFGIGILLLTFLSPRNFIADETEYLNQAISIARGTPEGWEIRSVIYPILIAPFVRIVEALFGTAPPVGILAARTANLAVACLSPLAVFLAGHRIGGRICAVTALAFTLFTWAWMWAAGRFMMDVPAGSWLALAVFALLHGRTRLLNTILLVLFGSLSVFTKFQMGPAVAVVGLLHLAAGCGRASRWRTALLMATTATVMLGLFCLSEYVVHGSPFRSLEEFYRYNVVDMATYQARYGPCEAGVSYLSGIPLVFSYLLPILMVLGVTFALYDRSIVVWVALVTIAYLASLLIVCHKEPRYLISVSPIAALLASYGAVRLLHAVGRWTWVDGVAGGRKRVILSFAFGGGVLAVVASLLPRAELPSLLTDREDCPSFVFASLEQLASAAANRPFALVHPCYVPSVYLQGYDVAFEDLGMSGYTRQLAIRNFRENVTTYGALVLESGSDREKILADELAGAFSLLRRSPLGQYAIYVAKQLPSRAAVDTSSGASTVHLKQPGPDHSSR